MVEFWKFGGSVERNRWPKKTPELESGAFECAEL